MQPAPAVDTAPLFQTINVSKHFAVFKALTNVSFHVDDGEFVSIVGPNGAGKTTLVNVVTGLLRPTEGEVRFMGHDIAGIGPVELARRGMARAFQLVNIFPALTVRETLAVAVASRLRRVGNPFRSLRRDDALQAEAERCPRVDRHAHEREDPVAADELRDREQDEEEGCRDRDATDDEPPVDVTHGLEGGSGLPAGCRSRAHVATSWSGRSRRRGGATGTAAR